MHATAMNHGRLFFETYLHRRPRSTIVEIGAQDVNGSLREVSPLGCQYVGVDFVAGPGVDVVLDDPYRLPFDDASIDAVVTSSCLEHSELFWLAFLEMLRILKPDGLLYLNVPSNGAFHRFPVDCWRFYPDSGAALVKWARRSGYQPLLLESFTGRQDQHEWNDFVAVFLKDEAQLAAHPERILSRHRNFDNGYRHGAAEFENGQFVPEDRRKLMKMIAAVNAFMKSLQS